jgi:hypothetical protein
MIPSEKLIITADDFGISPGVNQAVIESHLKGGLTNASLMVNGKYFSEALSLAREQAPGLKLGLHINLTGGKSVLPLKYVPHLVDSKGNFKYGPVAILLQTIINPHILVQIEREIEAQIKKLKENGIEISHFDGHHHVQMIPGVFTIVKKLADKYNVARIRVVNESIIHTISQTYNWDFLTNGGIARFALLKTLGIVNRYKTRTYFFSILHSCGINPDLIKDLTVPRGFDDIEIMLHPGNPEIDRNADIGITNEKLHLISQCRNVEFEVALMFGKNKEL